jgi:hypothetical protein
VRSVSSPLVVAYLDCGVGVGCVLGRSVRKPAILRQCSCDGFFRCHHTSLILGAPPKIQNSAATLRVYE